MKSLVFTFATVVWFMSMVCCAFAGTKVLFFAGFPRTEATLEQDAPLMAKPVEKASKGDAVEAMTPGLRTIFDFSLGPKDNRFQVKKAANTAFASIRQFTLSQRNSPQSSSTSDVANILKIGVERANTDESHSRFTLVMLCGGIQHDDMANFKDAFPADSWSTHHASPFSLMRRSSHPRMEVVFVSQPGDYINSFHERKIQRWYALLLGTRGIRVGFTTDHKIAAKWILEGIKNPLPIPTPVDIEGNLILNRIDAQTGYMQELVAPSPGVQVASTQIVTGSILSLDVEHGQAVAWISLIDPQGNPVTGLQAEQVQVAERFGGSTRVVPSEMLELHTRKDMRPLAIVLVRDVSQSLQGQPHLDAADAIGRFTELMSPKDLACLVNFSDQVTVVREFTQGPNLRTALNTPEGQGGTALYDALQMAVRKAKSVDEEYLGAVLAFSDGADNSSHIDASAVIREAGKVPIFLIGLGSVQTQVLKSIAQGTGGRYYAAPQAKALEPIYAEIGSLLFETYLLVWSTPAKDASELSVDVGVNFSRGNQSFQGNLTSMR